MDVIVFALVLFLTNTNVVYEPVHYNMLSFGTMSGVPSKDTGQSGHQPNLISMNIHSFQTELCQHEKKT